MFSSHCVWILVIEFVTMVTCTSELCSTKQHGDCGACANFTDSIRKAMVSGSDQDFLHTTYPFLNATLYSYYFRNESGSADHVMLIQYAPRGWRLLTYRYPALDSGHGMHALAFQRDSAPRDIMVVIRGTWVSLGSITTQEARADACAAWYLGMFAVKPKYCDSFDDFRINYYEQALAFISEVINKSKAGKPPCLVLTGRSLGGVVASLLSCAYGGALPAVVYGSFGARYGARKLGIDQTADSCRNVFNIFKETDLMTVMPRFLVNQVGWGCPYVVKAVISECLGCLEDNDFDLQTAGSGCAQCYLSEHSLSHIQQYYQQLQRPACKPWADVIASFEQWYPSNATRIVDELLATSGSRRWRHSSLMLVLWAAILYNTFVDR